VTTSTKNSNPRIQFEGDAERLTAGRAGARCDGRTTICIGAFIVALALVVLDASTWVELDVATIYGLPLVLAAAARSRKLVWILAASLTFATFGVYAWQVPSGLFTLREMFFVNRVLGAATLLLIAALLHLWITSANTSERQARLIQEQDEKLEAGKVSRRLVAVQETERRALANGLHDLVGQKLTALNINLNIVKGQLARVRDPMVDARLDESLTMVEETIESIRDVMVALRPAVLDDYGLAPGLRWYAGQFTKRTGVPVLVIGTQPGRRLAPATEEALFRIAQEALANVAKYAGAARATVRVDATSDTICLAIEDDGCGFDPEMTREPSRESGWGLMIMRERAAAVGAELRIDSAPARGTRIVVNCRYDATIA
jgi:signal transduction histidine kinase